MRGWGQFVCVGGGTLKMSSFNFGERKFENDKHRGSLKVQKINPTFAESKSIRMVFWSVPEHPNTRESRKNVKRVARNKHILRTG